ncbi:MAG: hypothetical protein J6A53_05420, partial [Clostridia bacterium]|nr:hypothetical protein [Clostridia bacterium]
MTKTRKILGIVLAVMILTLVMSISVFADTVAKIGDTEYGTFDDAYAAANAMTGDVVVEIYGSVEFVNGMELKGSYTSITFNGVGDANPTITINQSAGGDYLEAHGKIVFFNDLILAKANPAWSGNSGHMGNYFSIQGGTVTYNDCIFPNGACTNTGTAIYNNCVFENASEYGLWVYDDALVTVNGGTIDSKKGIKVYSEGETSVTSTLTVQNATFTENVTAKPAVAIGYAAEITLIGNNYNNTTGVLELDSGSDADCEGITFVAQDAEGNDIASTLTAVDRSNSNSACGVLVDGKIYTTATEAAKDAVAGSTVTLLFDSTETVEFAEGVTLDTNGHTAENVTVVVSLVDVNGTTYGSLQEALNAAVVAGDTVTVTLLDDIDLTGTTWTPVYFDSYKAEGTNTLIIDGNYKTITGLSDMLFSGIWTGTRFEVKNLTIDKATIKHDVDDTVGTTGVGAIVGKIEAIEDVVLNNVKLTNSHVEGGHWTGGFFGYIAGYSGNDGPVFTTVSITNSEVSNSTITGKGSVGGVVGHATGDAWTSFGIADSEVTGNTITSTGSSTNKAGIVAGTIGAAGTAQTTNGTTLTGGVSVSVTESKNTATSNGTEITTVYGRQGTSTGVLEITGGTYENYPIEENVSYAAPAEGYNIVENTDGTYGIVEAPKGDVPNGYVDSTKIWGQTWSNATESYVLKFYAADGTLMGTTTLNPDVYTAFDGDVEVTWHICFNGECTDTYWIHNWAVAPSVDNFPTSVELWVDGVNVNEGPVQFNGPDNINKIYALAEDADGNLTAYKTLAEAIANGGKVNVVRDVEESITAIENVTLITTVDGGVTITNTYSDDYVKFNNATLGTGVTLNVSAVLSSGGNSVNTIEGTMNVSGVYYHSSNAVTTIQNGGKVTTGGMTIVRYNSNANAGIYIYGDGDDSTVEFTCNGDAIGAYSGTFYAKDANVETKMLWLDYKKNNNEESDSYAVINAVFENSTLNVASELRLYKDASLTVVNSDVTAGKVQIRQDATPTVSVDADSTIKATSVENLTGASLNAVLGEDGTVSFDTVVAVIGTTSYTTLAEAFAAADEGDTIVLLADATPALKSQRAITKASVIDLNGKTLTLTEDDLYFGTTTFKNGTIVVDPSVKPSTAVFWMFANQTLTFDAVKLVATGVTGTYLIGLDGNNADLNIVNGSEIIADNETALDLDIICVNSSTGNDIVVDNSKVTVNNLDGRVFFRGNYTISGASEINLSGITKAGFRIEAGQTLSIEDTSVVTITGEPRDGGIHVTDATATYTKADTATVTATVNVPVEYVAQIGDVKYETLADAFAAIGAGDVVIELL